MNIGFLGLGGMGAAMASNLLKAGYQVSVWNRSADSLKPLLEQGAIAAQDPIDALRNDVVISMLADDAATRSVLLDSGALASAKPGLIHIGMATLSVGLISELVALHRERGVTYIAAPVFGRTDVARAGNLNILAAGPAEAIAQVQPLLDAMGQKTWLLGEDPLSAAVVKIAGNFMIASAIETMGESAALVKSHGVEPSQFIEIMTSTLFNAPVYRNYGPQIAEQRFSPAAFRLVLGLKDVGLALEAGQNRHVPLPFASVLRDSLLEAVARGDGELDWTALARIPLRRSGQD
ncbi:MULTISPECIES: NAD(P)-dependent oxidoreductase [Pseudomonas]|uniref:NAD(P)-dependent oxidoreductase n=1 Tax=Pseudomonas TaxID=286 RepID=UPI000C88C300|nr:MULTISPECIES: NAD(P)-dependent oxidoreductase [Pseudomonas]AZC69861.1 3-hydroxyisobutyrate dehydrogenase family protein [Pseudomonas chlororaphis subsp. piscium]AZC95909.1 3-hydroxyisobutyrate dehydrogenase family protein [Pseudomonas chlororaphis subsp. piscium]MBP5058617.1 NAD(P)-dependent oxidoreductase [Pseudomonas chlororaphis]MBP5142191.1 NAD(P)-dependent oxidoreductase [Pseudomonas chlororaphis]PMY35592.1 oxidoreductase [Pseudomonas sp. FW306-2-2C-D06C]